MPEKRPRRFTTALIHATGAGEAGRTLTESLPATLQPVGGMPLIDHLVRRLAAHGIERALVALHHHRATMAAHLETLVPPPRLEPVVVEGGLDLGAVIDAVLPRLGAAPFVVAAADALWLDGLLPALDRLAAAWDPERMDALLLLQSTVTARGYDGPGDYFVDPAGRARRRVGHEIAGHLFAGVAVLAPRALYESHDGAAGLTPMLEHAEGHGRLWAIAHDGLWFRFADPQDVAQAEIELGFRPMPAAEAEKLWT